MNLTRDRIHTIGWGTALALCLAVTAGVSARVSAEKSQAALAGRRIAGLHQEIGYLQTEFETRANQQALKQLNDTEFGYEAPTAAQYLDGERQLAALSKPAEPGAPAPVRFASADAGSGSGTDVAGGDHAAAARPIGPAVAVAEPAVAGTANPALLRASLRARLSHLGAMNAAGISRE